MIRQRIRSLVRLLAPLLLLAMMACGDEAPTEQAPAVELSAEEARAISDQLLGVVLQGLGFVERARDQIMASPPQGIDPTEIDISFDISHPCDLGGRIDLSGELSGQVELGYYQGNFTLDATTAVRECQFESDATVFTLNTEDPHIVIDAEAAFDDMSASASASISGDVHYSTDDDRSGTCSIDVMLEWSTAGGHSIVGAVCEVDVGG